MMALAPDKYTVAGDDLRTRELARAFMENILEAYLLDRAFIRGDANTDTAIDIADALLTLNYLFAFGPAPSCFDASDVNDDGVVNVADPIALLYHLLVPGACPPPEPFPECGPEQTSDSLGCVLYPPCE